MGNLYIYADVQLYNIALFVASCRQFLSGDVHGLPLRYVETYCPDNALVGEVCQV